MATRAAQRIGRLGAVLLMVMASVLLGSSAARAHSSLVSVTPADGARLTTPPSQLVLVFNEDINPNFAQVALTTQGQAIQLGTATVDGTTLSAAVPETLGPGDYIIAFRVVSADGHPISEQSTFTVLGSQTGGATGVATGPSAAASPDGLATETPETSEPEPTPTYKTPQGQETEITHPDHMVGIAVAVGLVLIGIGFVVVEHRRRSGQQDGSAPDDDAGRGESPEGSDDTGPEPPAGGSGT